MPSAAVEACLRAMTQAIMEKFLADEAQTLGLGAALAARLVAGDFLALHGELGAGKTTLARGLIQAFVGERCEVPSPTFTLVQTYQQASKGGAGLDLFHFDLYRLEDADEVWELGWEDIGAGIALVEWPQRALPHLPDNRLDIHLTFAEGGRQAHFSAKAHTSWKERLRGV
ncbi:MAG: hypothetical protein RL186_1834 [Pseudomonadota bacterium]